MTQKQLLKKYIIPVIAILIVYIWGQFSPENKLPTKPQANESQQSAANTTEALVVRIVDGDTIELQGGQKVRYIGIDTPELKQDECYAKEAAAKNADLVLGKKVTLQKDVSETDKYKRLLRYVYVDGVFVNQYLVAEGYANARSYPPDIAHQVLFKQQEREAYEAQKGFWNKENCPQK